MRPQIPLVLHAFEAPQISRPPKKASATNASLSPLRKRVQMSTCNVSRSCGWLQLVIQLHQVASPILKVMDDDDISDM